MTTNHLPPGENPLGRLSRFDGSTFHTVPEGSVDAPFVHVFVHGWQPGFQRQERLHALTDVLHALPAWDPRLTDATGRTLISYYQALLDALVSRGPDHCVLWYSWLDESATDTDLLLAFRSRQATQINGRRLALALQQASGRPDARLQLIGHSHGSAVAVHAAVSLGRSPEQVTLLDAPESAMTRIGGAADLIDAVLPRLAPGRDGDAPFVDSYTSVFGRPYHRKPGLSAVVDVALTPGRPPMRDPRRAINWAHLYAVEWYALSVLEPDRGVGYGWSPLTGADLSALSSSYFSALPRRPLDLRSRRDLPQTPGARRMAALPIQHTPVVGADLYLSSQAPDAALIINSVPGDFLVEFDLETEDDDNVQIQIAVDAVPAFVAQTRFPVPGAGRYVMLADGRPGEHLLTATMTGGASAVSITGVSVVNWRGADGGFSFQRTAWAIFSAGAVTGGLATAITLITASWTVRRVLARMTRRTR
ncbi:hypothetical protein GCM10022223_19860 [Kineosporia mesophila]|uniref:Alpha/beta hydrolase family protein n=1 Tax=Kineosporia mesophila TaxID=566012 RepID=A0ABP6ZEY9_9ACTN|nr:hypothetical protein [Kineosporia mesophila]MCD5353330.1 hypothetical protein [Kineosporia mesophila]